MIARTEQEIMESWIGDIQKPEVSICCTAYNHEKYIKEALNGMLMQISDFPFEIIVHDDASTDETVTIIKEYMNKFPNIIKPIFQTENQWSKGNRIMPIVFKHAKGNYIALCEGDDYWTDENKLQIQIDEMKKYPECEISFHYAVKKYEDNSNKDEIFCKHADEDRFFTTKDVIHFGGPLMPTASICLKKEFIDYIVASDNTFFKKDITAFFIQVLASLKGHVRYINRNMSVYRRMSEGSWTEATTNDYNYFIEWTKKSICSLETVDCLTDFKYTKELNTVKKRHYLNLMSKKSIPVEKRQLFIEKHIKEIGLREKILLYFVYQHPTIHKVLSYFKNNFLRLKNNV